MKFKNSSIRWTSFYSLIGFGLLCVYLEASPRYSAWSAPQNLGSVINSLSDDFLSDISKDGRSLYFTSNRPGFGGEDIWVSQRTTVSSPWGSPLNLGVGINTSHAERTPSLSRDGHYLFFVTDRPGGLGGLDVWVCWRRHTDNDFGWEAPQHLGAMNSPFNDAGPAYLEDEDSGTASLYFASNRPGGVGAYDIYVSQLTATGAFGPAALVHEFSSPQVDLRPAFRTDGLEVILTSNRIGTIGGRDLWVSTRPTVHDNWSTPVNLGAGINTPFDDSFASLSSDSKTLFFNSDRRGTVSGGLDLYMTTRTKFGQP